MNLMTIDLSRLNQDEFDLKTRGERILITPKKSKHVWETSEKHLRSLVVDQTGRVLSSGLPKFLNYGEQGAPNEEFKQALAEGRVEFPEKLDGSLIIMDLIDGKVEFRTRGQTELGAFEDRVMALIAEKYPHMIEDFRTSPGADEVSICFEYISPENRIVVPYEEAELVLLTIMDKEDLRPLWPDGREGNEHVFAEIKERWGVRVVNTHDLPSDFQELMVFVKGWQDKEGVVARFVHEGEPMMVKIKASQYVKLHALKSRLSGNVGKLLFLLGASTAAQARDRLFDLGVDYESQVFVQGEIDAYVEQYATLVKQYALFNKRLMYVMGAEDYDGSRKMAAGVARTVVDAFKFPNIFFNAAMKIYDNKPDEGWQMVVGSELLKESVGVLRQWLTNPMIAVNDVLSVPVIED